MLPVKIIDKPIAEYTAHFAWLPVKVGDHFLWLRWCMRRKIGRYMIKTVTYSSGDLTVHEFLNSYYEYTS